MVLAAVLLAIALAPNVGLRATVLTSGSMAPTVPTGGMIAVQEVDPADIEVGDVITFSGYTEDRLVTHRVISLHEVDGQLHFRTQGDANESPDGDLAPAAGVVGRMRWDLTPLGPVLIWLAGSRATMLLPGIAGLWLALGEVRDLRRAHAPAEVRSVEPRREASPPGHPAVSPTWLAWPPVSPAPARVAAPVAAPQASAEPPADVAAPAMTWSAPTSRRRLPTPTARHGGARFATIGLATVLVVSAVQVSAGSFLDTASTSAATIFTTAVEAPTDVSASFDCGLLTIGKHVVVSWTGVSGADDYEVRRRSGTSGDFTAVGTTSSTSFSDTTVALDTTYEYVVVTRAGTWESSPSSPPAQVTTPSACVA